uniref:Glycosyl transferase family 1 domain-containing protein n=1 Tax=viral metagenome TaxID=1070528 RepID=A0A6C0J2R1_9ZZZZ
MRFVLVSTHVDQTTGYSKVAANLLKQVASLSPKVKTFHFGFQRHPERKGMRKAPDGIVQYDAAANEDPKEEGFGFNKIKEYLEMVTPDVVMIYNDPLIVCKFLDAMKERPFKLWVYLDQVYTGIAQPLMDKIAESVDRVYCFTDEWKKVYLTYPKVVKDVRVLEHAVDPTIFSNLPREVRDELRTKMNVPRDGIVFLNANRNSQRKRLDLTIQAFVRLLAKNPALPLYLMIVSNINPQAGAWYDVSRIYGDALAAAGLPATNKNLLLVDTAPPNALTDETINQIYNICDIGINTGDGEGFGLCQLEHMYTGAPQVVTDVGSYRSFLNESVADIVPAQRDRTYMAGSMPLGLSTPVFLVDDIVEAMVNSVRCLSERRTALKSYEFKTWASICKGWLDDLHQEST